MFLDAFSLQSNIVSLTNGVTETIPVQVSHKDSCKSLVLITFATLVSNVVPGSLIFITFATLASNFLVLEIASNI